jgi:hypothetical protein
MACVPLLRECSDPRRQAGDEVTHPWQPLKLGFRSQTVVESAKDCIIDIVGVCAFGSGLRIFKASSTSGVKRYSPANTKRSMLLNTILLGALRRSTFNWCRRTRISASSRALVRNTR